MPDTTIGLIAGLGTTFVAGAVVLSALLIMAIKRKK